VNFKKDQTAALYFTMSDIVHVIISNLLLELDSFQNFLQKSQHIGFSSQKLLKNNNVYFFSFDLDRSFFKKRTIQAALF
jgi:hypothetical protein